MSIINLADPQAKGLILLQDYAIDPNASDLSSNRLNGTLVNAPNVVGGKFGRALLFNGSNQYANIPNNDILTCATASNDLPFSICAWINLDKDIVFGSIISKWTQFGDQEFAFQIAPSTLLLQLASNGNTANRLIGQINLTIPTNKWIHVVCTYSGVGNTTGFKFYIDGIRNVTGESYITDGTYNYMVNHSAPVTIGACLINNSTYASFFKGSIANVYFYKNRELSPTDVFDLYTNPLRIYKRPSSKIYYYGAVSDEKYQLVSTKINENEILKSATFSSLIAATGSKTRLTERIKDGAITGKIATIATSTKNYELLKSAQATGKIQASGAKLRLFDLAKDGTLSGKVELQGSQINEFQTLLNAIATAKTSIKAGTILAGNIVASTMISTLTNFRLYGANLLENIRLSAATATGKTAFKTGVISEQTILKSATATGKIAIAAGKIRGSWIDLAATLRTGTFLALQGLIASFERLKPAIATSKISTTGTIRNFEQIKDSILPSKIQVSGFVTDFERIKSGSFAGEIVKIALGGLIALWARLKSAVWTDAGQTTIREQIIAAFVVQAQNLSVLPVLRTKRSISESNERFVSVWDGADQTISTFYDVQRFIFPVSIEAILRTIDHSTEANSLMGEIITLFEQHEFSGKWLKVELATATPSYPQDGSNLTTVNVTFNVTYETVRGDPYAQY